MAQTKISQLTELSSIADNDVLAGVDTSAGTTKKVKMSTIKNYISGGGTVELQSNKVTAFSSPTNTQYPSAKLTYDQLALKENVSNKVTTLDENSTDTQYPSAKCVYDIIGNLEDILEELDIGGGV